MTMSVSESVVVGMIEVSISWEQTLWNEGLTADAGLTTQRTMGNIINQTHISPQVHDVIPRSGMVTGTVRDLRTPPTGGMAAFPVLLKESLPLALRLTLLCILAGIMVVGMLGNSVVCIIVYQKPAMRSAINLLLANMALSNILLSILCMPLMIATLAVGHWPLGDVMCRISAFLQAVLVCEAVYTLLTISLDRYLIIVRRKDKLNPRRARGLLVFSWCTSAGISLPPTIGWSLYRALPGWAQCILHSQPELKDRLYAILWSSVVHFLPMVLMGYAYVCILITVRKNARRIHNHPESLSVSQANRLGLVGLARLPRMNVDMSFKTRAFKTILILYLVYVVCWAPYAICSLVWNLQGHLRYRAIPGNLLLWLGYMNSAINPAIYCCRIKKFREACLEIMPRTFKFVGGIPGWTRRRINPGAMYECSEQQRPGQQQTTL